MSPKQQDNRGVGRAYTLLLLGVFRVLILNYLRLLFVGTLLAIYWPMATIATLRTKLESIGCTLEQDLGGRFEVWQCVAPVGKVWKSGEKHIRLEWMPGVATSKLARISAIKDALERISFGLRMMTPDEQDFYAE